jgi:hypothetical protein
MFHQRHPSWKYAWTGKPMDHVDRCCLNSLGLSFLAFSGMAWNRNRKTIARVSNVILKLLQGNAINYPNMISEALKPEIQLNYEAGKSRIYLYRLTFISDK